MDSKSPILCLNPTNHQFWTNFEWKCWENFSTNIQYYTVTNRRLQSSIIFYNCLQNVKVINKRKTMLNFVKLIHNSYWWWVISVSSIYTNFKLLWSYHAVIFHFICKYSLQQVIQPGSASRKYRAFWHQNYPSQFNFGNGSSPPISRFSFSDYLLYYLRTC